MLQTILDTLPATLNCKDAEGRYVLMNSFQARQLALHASEVIGTSTADLYGETWASIVRDQDTQVLSTGRALGPYREDYNSLGEKAGYWLTYKFPLLLGKEGKCDHVATISFDITPLYEAEQNLRSASYTDALTGLLNRRWLDHRIDEWERGVEKLEAGTAVQHPAVVGILIIDIDHFKRINDSWGHSAGDEALREMAKRLQDVVRASDQIVRLGGEEFLVIMQDASVSQIKTTAERIRSEVAAIPFHQIETQPSITVSIGCSQVGDARTIKKSLEAADNALYVAKGAGRNRVAFDTGNEIEC